MPADFTRFFYFLGAGASFPAKVPLARGFVSKIWERVEELAPHDDGLLRKAFKDVCRFVWNKTHQKIDIEGIYRCIDEAMEAKFAGARDKFAQPPSVAASRSIERLQYEIKKVIQRECSLSEKERVTYLRRIPGWIARCGYLPIVSMNYDNVVELFCQENGIDLVDPVLDGPRVPGQGGILLLKLHGSITWILDEASGLICRADLKGVHAGQRKSGGFVLNTR